ncbi:hypothetical protein EMPG_10341 [Blastomyces silverae]|uniref:Uncharacterized protein n=1 Tax=Blastomyces silverae TaxID=2060906 RepID=A0A0H1BAF1_9EURO|nr:hypothetical protein EMPG_10341 [Blastomyces silverae]
MADAFSAAAGVISVISLVYQITQTAVRFGDDWKAVPGDVKSFLAQLQALKTALAEINANLTVSTEFADAFRDQNRESALLSQLGQAAPNTTDTNVLISDCQKNLDSLLQDLKKRQSKLQAGKGRLSWEKFRAACKAKNLRSSVENLHRQCQILNSLITIDTAILAAATFNEVKEGRAENQTWQQSRETRQILKWLAESENGAELSDYLSRRQDGTGDWIFNRNELKRWIESDGKCTLFCPGLPGAGKSIMASIIVDELYRRFHKDDNVGIAFWFFDLRRHDEEKIPERVLASLLKQLLSTQPSLPQAVEELYHMHKGRGTRPSPKELSSALESVLGRYSRVFIVVDALDECPTFNGSLNTVLNTIFKLQGQYPVKFLATSRFIPEIAVKFRDIKSVFLEIRASDSDVEKYLREHMSQLPSFVRTSADDIQEEIIKGIRNAVDGMFLLARFHLDSLTSKPSLKAIRKALEKLPRGSNAYDAVYQNTMERIENQPPVQVDLAKRIISWIVCTRRPLKVIELRHALAVEPQENELDQTNLPDENMMLSTCAGLVTVDSKSRIIRLVHYTAQQYFDRTQASWFLMAHKDIATTCLAYLSFDVFSSRTSERDEERELLLKKYRFYDYSAKNWGHHARGHSVEESLVMDFLGDDFKVAASAKHLDIPLDIVTLDESFPPPASNALRILKGTFLAAHFGLDSVLRAILDNTPSYARLRDSKGRTPLCYAAGSGHRSVVELLLEKGAELNHSDAKGYSPLLRATGMGHTQIVKLMLERRADPNTETDLKYTPLLVAAEQGHANLLELLLRKNADPNLKTYWGETALYAAVLAGEKEMIKILLEHAAFVDSENIFRRTALSRATLKGDEAMVKMLLEAGAYPNLKDDCGRTCFYRASEKNNVAVANLLLQNGADPQLATDRGETPLSTAVEKGHDAIVKLLLTIGVALDTKDEKGRTPLFMAAAGGHEGIIKLLLENGLDPNCEDTCGQTPLFQAAFRHGKKEIIQLLLQNGADPKARDKMGQTLLSLSAKGAHGAAFKLFLESGVDVETIDVKGKTPLSEAARSGFKEGVKILLDKGANPNHKDRIRCTPLIHAVKGNHASIELIRMLLQKGADPNLMDKKGQTPLSIAAENGLKLVVELLLDEGANLEPVDREGMTPLSKAADKADNDEMLKMLLDRGSNPNHRNYHGRTPLSQAVSRSHGGTKGVIKLLLENGADPNLKDTLGQTILAQVAASQTTFLEEEECQIVELLLEKGAKPDLMDVHGRTPLSHAVGHGSSRVATHLLRGGADFNVRDADGRTPLSRAAAASYRYCRCSTKDPIRLVKLLLAHGATLESRDNNGRNALSWAVMGEHDGADETVKFFLEQGLDIESRDDYGRTPLSWAVQAALERHSIVKLLLERGAEPDSRDNSGRSPLSWALTARGNPNHTETIVDILLAKEVEVDSRDDQGRSPLLYAAWEYPEIVGKLLAKGADPDSKDVNGRGPVSYAAGDRPFPSRAGIDAVRILVEKGADPDFKDNSGRAPISYAAAKAGGDDIVAMLLEKGVDLDFADNAGRTPLSWAASTGALYGKDMKKTKLLLDKGSNPNFKDNDGRTPLSRSAEHCEENVVALLLERGAQIDSEDKNGRTPLSWAASGRGSATKLLLEKGAEFDCKDVNGRTPLSWATMACHSFQRENSAKQLLKKGADPDSKDDAGRSPLYWALSRGHWRVAGILFKKGADPSCRDSKGSTPLSKAEEKVWERAVKLLSNGAEDPDEVYGSDNDDDTMKPQFVCTKKIDPDFSELRELYMASASTRGELRVHKM